MLDSIAKELKSVRIKKDLTMLKVAEDNGFSIETLRRYEDSCSGLSIEQLEKILKYYDTDINIFFRNVCENMHNLCKENL